MGVWELHPADDKKLVISLDADTQEEAIAKAKEIAYMYEGKVYENWICNIPEPAKDKKDKKEKIKNKKEEKNAKRKSV